MKKPEDLTKEELVDLVTEIQAWAFLEVRENKARWNPDLELSSEFIGGVCGELYRFQLDPEYTSDWFDFPTNNGVTND